MFVKQMEMMASEHDMSGMDWELVKELIQKIFHRVAKTK